MKFLFSRFSFVVLFLTTFSLVSSQKSSDGSSSSSHLRRQLQGDGPFDDGGIDNNGYNNDSEMGTLFEGDIKATYEQIHTYYGQEVADIAFSRGVLVDGGDRRLALTNNENFLWACNEVGVRVIPYEIAAGHFSAASQQTIINALNSLAATVGSIEFRARTVEVDYIRVINDSGCWSYVGRQGGMQLLSLQDFGCVFAGIIQHEFMHAMGIWHEQR